VDHARYATDVVVTAADEAYEGLPGILSQDPDARELGRLLPEVGIGGGPLLVQLAEVWGEVEVVLDQGEGIVLVGDD
jgi:hypothetical protein